MATYYVDARNGSDSNSGQSQGTAWRSIAQVNRQNLQPGDKVLFHRGQTFDETLVPKTSGTKDKPIVFGAYGSGSRPEFDGEGDNYFGAKIRDVDHIRLEGLTFTGATNGVRVENSKGTELVDLHVHGNSRNGIEIKGGSGNTVSDGQAYDNGSTGQSGPANGRLGHGILFSSGAKDNVVENMALHGNVEDGVQFGPKSGSGNIIRDSKLYGNDEDGIDIKGGSQTIENNQIYGNAEYGVFIHDNADLIRLVDNVIEAVSNGLDAMAVMEGARVESRGNTYEGGAKRAVKLWHNAGDESSFIGDMFIDGGTKTKISVSVAGGTDHVFGGSAFIMRNEGFTILVEGKGGDITVRNSVLYSKQGTLLNVSNGSDAATDGNIYYRADKSTDWIRFGSDRYGHEDIVDGTLYREQGTDRSSKVQNPEINDLLANGPQSSSSSPTPPDTTASGVDDPPPPPTPKPTPAPDTGSQEKVQGTSGNDRLKGDGDDETFMTGGGNDTVWAGKGDDSIHGEDGDDSLHGQDGNDRMFGGAGDDRLHGGWGNDRMSGGTGDDYMTGGGMDDVLEGKNGNDEMYGGNGNDSLHGGWNDDLLFGEAGNDTLTGGGRNDELYGGGGNDRLVGGKDDDVMHGGSGRDTFVFERGDGHDVVADFVRGDDKIDLSDYGFGSMADVKIEQNGSDAVVVLGGGNASVTLAGTSRADLDSNDFILQAPVS